MNVPVFSVITPVFNPDFRELRDCLRSARAQGVEHILALDGEANVSNLQKLKSVVESYGAKLIVSHDRLGISGASNLAAAAATGEFLVFLDQDDFLEENWWSPLLVTIENADFIYSDSFHADASGNVVSLHRKPAWSPVRLLFLMYATHFMAVRRSVFENVGGFRTEFDGSQDHDLALRISRVTNRFRHIPIPLYSWRQSKASSLSDPGNKSWAYDAGAAAATSFLQEIDKNATVEKILDFHPGGLRARFSPRTEPVSIVVPTAFGSDYSGNPWLNGLLDSLLPFLDGKIGDEVILVHGGEDDFGLVERFRKASQVRTLSVFDNRTFNFSRRVNIGFSLSQNNHVLLLNDDVQFGTENPLDDLFGLLSLENVGVVGGLLAYPDFSIQHAGHSFVKGHPVHAGLRAKSFEIGVFDLIVDREVVGVTGALMFQLKSTWQSVGGFTTSLPLSFNDVDYCQKVRSLGFSVIQANSVKAFHHESVTREAISEYWEVDFIERRWSDVLSADRFSSPYR
jgi:GT2 family glycosyltransferase